VLNECSKNGKLYYGATQPAGINESNEYGTGVTCPELPELAPARGVRYVAQSAKVPAFRVSYAKGKVGVTWNSATKISGGTVNLINQKGVTVSSGLVSVSGKKVTASLGAGTIPAGIYYVRVSLKDVDGKKIVQQASVSIVK
jgi:hypothetical protein